MQSSFPHLGSFLDCDDGWRRIPGKTLVHILLIRDGMRDRSRLERKLHQFLELRSDDTQIPVSHAIGRVLHDELNDVRVLIEEIASGCYRDRLVAVGLLYVEPYARA